MSPFTREILLWIGIAVILTIVIFAADRQQPETKVDVDEDLLDKIEDEENE